MKNPRLIPVAVLALLTAVLGGYLCGIVLDQFGEFGGISLWGLGALAGFVANGMRVDGSRLAAWMLVAATVFAFLFAETCWIHWNIRQGQESWLAAIAVLPRFAVQYKLAALIGAVFTGFGATSAYRQVAVRYVKVPVRS